MQEDKAMIKLARISPITEVVLPMVNIDKPWYTPRGYDFHPPCRDRNLESYGDTDLGEPLQAPFAGFIETAANLGMGWGNVIRICGYRLVESGVVWYAWQGGHFDTLVVQVGQIVEARTRIGTLGRTGLQPTQGAHLHEQLSSGILPPVTLLGGKAAGFHWIDCDGFYRKHGIDAALLASISAHDGR